MDAKAPLRGSILQAILQASQSVEIFEVRPNWRDKTHLREHPIAKATFNNTNRTWKVYWRRADLKWHTYQPNAEVARIEDFLEVVDKDENGCFFG